MTRWKTFEYGALSTPMLSGLMGTGVILKVSQDDHAMNGISSRERRDSPFLIELRTENVIESGDNSYL